MRDDKRPMTEEELIAAYIELVGEFADVTPANLAQPNPNRFVQSITTDSALMEDMPIIGTVSA